MNKTSLIWLCILLSCAKIHGQNYGGLYESIKLKSTPTKFEKLLDSVLLSVDKKDHDSIIAVISHAFSIKFYREGNFGNAIKYAKIEVTSLEKSETNKGNYEKALYNLGLFYYRNKELHKSIDIHQKVISLGLNNKKTGQSYCEIGRAYNILGDFHKAIDYYKNGLYILEDLKDYRSIITKSLNLAPIYVQLDTKSSLESMKLLLERTEELSKTISMTETEYSVLNNNFAIYFTSDRSYNFRSAKKYYFKNLVRAEISRDSSAACASYANLGKLYNNAKNDSAHYFLKNGLRFCKTIDLATTYHLLSDYDISSNDLTNALENIQQALNILTNSNDNYKTTPSYVSLTNTVDKYALVVTLKKKIDILIKFYKVQNEPYFIELALAHSIIADKLIDLIQDESSENDSKLHWRKEASSIYLKGVLCCEILNKNELAYNFAEKNKALLLAEDVRKNVDRVSLPENILNQELEFKKSILSIENTLSQEHSPSEIKKLQNSLFTTKLNYQKFNDSLKINFPQYSVLKTFHKSYELIETQNILDEKTIIITYVWDTSDDQFETLFGVLISKEQVELFKIANAKSFEKLVDSFRIKIQRPFETFENKKSFNETAYQLYARLFPKKKLRELVKNKKLIIIPDNKLQNIPFEALISNIDTGTYFLEQCEISYAYSSSFLFQNSDIHRDPSKMLISFAPVNFNKQKLDSLPNSISEVNKIQSILGGEKIIRSNATKAAFLQNSNDYKIIHLATHSDANNNPWVAFTDTILELQELYTFKNQADLVVLSSCNSSLGEIASGEGVMSLARGFFYSGANSVLSSIWNANDTSTETIMSSFYQNLKNGDSKSEALHYAKIDYLKNTSLSESSPYYWAPFILNGNYDKTNLSPSYTPVYLSSSFLFLVGLFLLYKRNKRLNQSK